MNRRNFLFHLCAGTSLAIAGSFIGSIIPAKSAQVSDPSVASDLPELSAGINKSYVDNKLVLSGKETKCIVNQTGEKIIELLDGKRSIAEISLDVSKHYSIENNDALEASVAGFICQLGECGFLVSPFYVVLYETC